MVIDYAKELNTAQLEGVTATEGAVLVLAGAGSGKTRLLTYKIAYLVREVGVHPNAILAVTFTNKAAREMRERVEKLLERDMSHSWMGTFHSMCGKILRFEAKFAGLKPEYTIYDSDDSLALVRAICREMGYEKDKADFRKIRGFISTLKTSLVTPQMFEKRTNTVQDNIVAKVYAEYEQRIRKAEAVDFDDMIVLTLKLFQTHEDVRKKYESMFEYILVDEFQDTNDAQFQFLNLLTRDRAQKNITVVGDDDQSIYSWRGAQVKNILDFPNRYAGCRTIRLEENYRSTSHILDAAANVIANNKMRHKKRIFTEGPCGEKVCIQRFDNDYDEAASVVDTIGKLIASGIKPSGIAILYRVNMLSRLFEQKFCDKGIPYIIIGGLGFYERAEIKDLLAYLRLAVNHSDNIAFRRVVNTPRRGIGTSTMEKIEHAVQNFEKSLFDVISRNVPIEIPERQRKILKEFAELIEEIGNKAKNNVSIADIIRFIVEITGYAQELIEEGDIQSQSRVENIGQLVSAAVDYANDNPDATLVDFLASISLLTDVDSLRPDDEKVELMTVHASKGLEFDVVFIVGVELGIFPLSRALEQENEMEEERRLFYVAITRAKKRVFVTHTLQRNRYGTTEVMPISPFVQEIPAECSVTQNVARAGTERRDADFAPLYNRQTPYTSSTSFRRGSSSEFKTGDKVFSKFFGEGKVLDVRGAGNDAMLTVEFKRFGIKKLVAGFAKLEKI